jgi:hypothetical protein
MSPEFGFIITPSSECSDETAEVEVVGHHGRVTAHATGIEHEEPRRHEIRVPHHVVRIRRLRSLGMLHHFRDRHAHERRRVAEFRLGPGRSGSGVTHRRSGIGSEVDTGAVGSAGRLEFGTRAVEQAVTKDRML